MNYTIDKKNYRINIYGTSSEIKKWIYAISDVSVGGESIVSQFEDTLENIESIVDKIYMEFINYDRLYFDRNSIIYLPNAHSKSSKKNIFEGVILPYFEKAKENYLNK